jgi:hypothetical protein
MWKEKIIMSPRMRRAKAGILVAAFISFLLSIYLWFSGSQDQGIFVGIWVPSILSFGTLIFSGSDRRE